EVECRSDSELYENPHNDEKIVAEYRDQDESGEFFLYAVCIVPDDGFKYRGNDHDEACDDKHQIHKSSANTESRLDHLRLDGGRGHLETYIKEKSRERDECPQDAAYNGGISIKEAAWPA